MDMLITRLRPVLLSMSGEYPTDPFLAPIERRKLEWVVQAAEHILDTFEGRHY
jgi:hypothetical protein